ncbi:MAG TPA: TIGR03118 family protein [Acidobacteriaceae bacterium]|nr:TIGR03118 family protein [Acidobacteriaceae bacterium]
MHHPFGRRTLRASVALVAAACSLPALAQHYKQTNLVSDQSGVAATTDTNLVNPWGLSRSSGSPWWASDNGSGLATLYAGTGTPASLVVTVPTGDPDASSTGSPTGTLFNGTTGFTLAAGKPALFMFVTEDGTISGWNPGVKPTTAVIEVNTKSASVFKGAALASVNFPNGESETFLYVADFRKGRVQVYDSSFHHVTLMEEMFRDDRVRHGFAPFNVQNIGGDLYVTYAKQDDQKHDPVAGAGLGYVDVFSPLGFFERRLEHGWWLNAPWGVAMAPGDFGIYSHDLLVGNFGSGLIDVFDPATGEFKGMLNDASNHPITIDGLWDLSFGSGGTSGSATALYFSAGPDGEQHGLFGTITPVENTLGNSR